MQFHFPCSLYLSNSRRSESASVALFFIAVFVPILFALFSIGAEIGTIYINRAAEQKILDTAAIIGAQRLPYLSNATQAAQFHMQNNSYTVSHYGAQTLSATASSDSIKLELNIPVKLPLAAQFGFTESMTMKLNSIARVQPRDVAIYMDTSHYMMPQNAGQFWGKFQSDGADYTVFTETNVISDSPDWRPATFFKNYGTPTLPVANYRTQFCFNPVLSAVKEATIRLYYALSQFQLNSVGIFTGPSNAAGVYTIRSVDKGGFPTPLLGEASIENITASASGGWTYKDSHCLAAAETADAELQAWKAGRSEVFLDNNLPPARMRNAFPSFSSEMDQQILLNNGMPSSLAFTDPTTGNFNAGVNKYVSVREAVWARRAHKDTALSIGPIINTVGQALVNAPLRTNDRGALVNKVTKTGYVILGHFPHANVGGALHNYTEAGFKNAVKNQMKSALDNLNSNAANKGVILNLYILMVRQYWTHPGCAELEPHCDAYMQDAVDLMQYVDQWETNLGWHNLRVNLIRVVDPDSMVTDLLSILPATERMAFLANDG